MLKVSFLEFIIRGIPEGLVFFIAVYGFTKNHIQLKRYLLSSIIYSCSVYVIRFFPIQNGEDFILNLIVLIVLTVTICRIDIIKAIKAGIIIMVIEFICEGINVFIIQFVMKKNVEVLFKNTKLKILYSSPSILFFSCIAIGYYIIFVKRKELKNT